MRCRKCNLEKSADEFPRDIGPKSRRNAVCKKCGSKRGWDVVKERHGDSRHYHYRQRYGIGLAEVEAMKAAQGGLCAICRTNPAVQVDHDHRTKKVRGILCDGCNGGLGLFEDDIHAMKRAIEYLERDRV